MPITPVGVSQQATCPTAWDCPEGGMCYASLHLLNELFLARGGHVHTAAWLQKGTKTPFAFIQQPIFCTNMATKLFPTLVKP